MDRKYIDAEKLQKRIERKRRTTKTWQSDNFIDGYNDAIGSIKSMVHSFEAADVQKLKHGHWIPHMELSNVLWYNCSECNAYIVKNGITAKKYCYNCGAKMEAKE